jgi:hypothetical protein
MGKNIRNFTWRPKHVLL